MVVAMMVPVTLPVVRHVGLNSIRRRRQQAIALYTTVYVGAWVLFGVTALGSEHLLRVHLGFRDHVLLARALVLAACWQLTRAKRRALFACGRTVPLPPLGRRADAACVAERTVEPGKYTPSISLQGESVLLIDDTWTTGGSVQSAAGALRGAGAVAVGVVVIGRHIHEGYGDNGERLRALPRPFDWTRCALESAR